MSVELNSTQKVITWAIEKKTNFYRALLFTHVQRMYVHVEN
jgi:hypothetical protein